MNNFLYYTVAFLVVLGVLILVHELGHYFVARLAGVKVLRFSIGFGRPLYSRVIGEDRTEWSIGAMPLGGYVKMLDENEGEIPPEERHRSFNRQSVWRRMAIVVAGPLANFLLAILIYWGHFWYGTEELRPILGEPVISSPAAHAGIASGERVVKINGELVESWQALRWHLLSQAAEKDIAVLEVINPRHEISFRNLDLRSVRESGWQGDALERLGLRFFQPKIPPIVGKLSPDGVAAASGLRVDDEIVRIDRMNIDSWQTLVKLVRSSPGRALQFEITRNGIPAELTITPAAIQENGLEIGRIGAGVKDFGNLRDELLVTVRYSFGDALGKALSETWDKTVFSLSMIGKMLTGEVSWHNISGPITIADYAGQSAKSGASQYLKFIALISISLGVLNLLPIPILDGGHLLYYVAEAIRRKPLSERSMEIGQKIGMFLLVLLMACSFYNDINRLISG